MRCSKCGAVEGTPHLDKCPWCPRTPWSIRCVWCDGIDGDHSPECPWTKTFAYQYDVLDAALASLPDGFPWWSRWLIRRSCNRMRILLADHRARINAEAFRQIVVLMGG